MTSPHSASSRTGLAAASLTIAFIALYCGTSRGVFVYGDDVLMYQVTQAIAERGSVSVTSSARSGDVTHAVEGRDGKRYAKYGIGQSLAALPFFALAHPLFDRWQLPETRDRFGNLRTGAAVFATGLTNAVSGGLAVGLLFLLAVEIGFSLPVAVATALSLGLGTLWLHYSSTFLSEPLSGFLLLLAFFGRARFGREARTSGGMRAVSWWLAISGFAAGMAVATKLANVVVVFPLFLWVLVAAWRGGARRRRVPCLLSWSVPFGAWVIGIGYYNLVRFGSTFESGYREEATNFSTPFWEGLGGLLLSPAKGVLWYCPLLLLSLGGMAAFYRRDRALALAIGGASLLHLLLAGHYYAWYGGDVWGPRLLVPLLPLWLLPLGEQLAAWQSSGRARRFWTATLLTVSLLVTLASVAVPFDDHEERISTSRSGRFFHAWDAARSPLVHHLEQLPSAGWTTLQKLTGRLPVLSATESAAQSGSPDFAFVRYGSHSLLGWTRASLAIFLLALGGAVGCCRIRRPTIRSQKASASSPPQ